LSFLGAHLSLEACESDLLEGARRLGEHGGTLSDDAAIELGRHHERHLLGAAVGRSREWRLLWRRRRECAATRRCWLRLAELPPLNLPAA